MPHLFPIDRYLNVRSASSPSFSPDGQHIAYISNTTGIPQIWLIPTFGGEPVQLTFGNDAVRSVHFSPVRNELIFSMDTGGNERMQLYRLFGIGDTAENGIGDGWDFENLTNNPNAIHMFGGWSRDGTRIAFSANREDASRFDICTMDLACRERQRPEEPRLLAKCPGVYFTALEWSPDDRYILAVRNESNVNQDLYIIVVATAKLLHVTPHKGDVQYHSAVWMPNGRAIICVSTHGDKDRTQEAIIDLPTCEVEFKYDSEYEVEHVAVSRRGKWMAVDTNVDGSSQVLLSGMSHEKEIVLPRPIGVVSSVAFSPDEAVLAMVFDGPRHNSDIWTIDLSDPTSDPVRLTHSGRAGLPFREFIEPELVHYMSFDGRMIPAWWYAPISPMREQGTDVPPVIVYPHGGPESQTRPNFSALFQYFLARGYAILAPNVRGSSGYGTAFMNLDNIEKRMDSVADLAHAAHWIRDEKKGDPKRIAVYGGSYGGFMVLAALTHYPDLWAAGIDVVGICNFVTFLEKTGDWRLPPRKRVRQPPRPPRIPGKDQSDQSRR
jgi:dipeptidyl aminopeptidase/acylaminoacyl peptidase